MKSAYKTYIDRRYLDGLTDYITELIQSEAVDWLPFILIIGCIYALKVSANIRSTIIYSSQISFIIYYQSIYFIYIFFISSLLESNTHSVFEIIKSVFILFSLI